MVTQDRVLALVDRHMRGPMVWGVSDCCLSVAAVFDALHGTDIMRAFRGRYRGESGAQALLRCHGGLLRLVRAEARVQGMQRGCGDAGELGVVRADTGHCMAICIGDDVWAGRIDNGYATVTGAVLRCRR